MSVIFPTGTSSFLSVDNKYAQDVDQVRNALEKKGYLNSEVNEILQDIYSQSDPYAALTGGSSSSGKAEDSAEAMLEATLAGLKAQGEYSDKALEGIEGFKTEGLQGVADYENMMVPLYQAAAQKALAAIQGVSDADLREGYDNAIATYQNEIANINGIVTDIVGMLDKEKAENPIYSLDRSLDTFRGTFEQIARQTADDLMNFNFRAKNPGGKHLRQDMASTMFGQMVSQVPQLHRQVQEANQWLTDKRIEVPKWGGTLTAGLSTNLANTQVGKGTALTDLNRWKAGSTADTLKWEAGGIGDVKKTGLGTKTNVLTNAMNAQTKALGDAGNIAGKTAYTESMKGNIDEILGTSGTATGNSGVLASLGLTKASNKLNPTHTTYAYQNSMKGFADPTKKKTNSQNMYTV